MRNVIAIGLALALAVVAVIGAVAASASPPDDAPGSEGSGGALPLVYTG